MTSPAPRTPLRRSEGGDAGMVSHLLLLGILVLVSGTIYVFATQFTGDANVDTGPMIAVWPNDEGKMQFLLVTESPTGPYNIDLNPPTTNDVRFRLAGNECSYDLGELVVEGEDALWDVGEKVTLLNDCNGQALRPFIEYSITISVWNKVIFQDDHVRVAT